MSLEQGQVYASAPDAIKGLIEARGVGILSAQSVGSVAVSLVVDMSMLETARLPPERETIILAQSLPLLYKLESRYFPAAILQYLRQCRD
jgi:HPr kinase/phosphorylase